MGQHGRSCAYESPPFKNQIALEVEIYGKTMWKHWSSVIARLDYPAADDLTFSALP